MLENESLFLHFRPTVDDGEPKLLGHSDHIERERERERQTETETERDRDRDRERQRQRETETERERDRERERERERERCTFLYSLQCDQMARSNFPCLPIGYNENVPNSKENFPK